MTCTPARVRRWTAWSVTLPAAGLPTQRATFDAQGRIGTAEITLHAPADTQCLACHGSGGGPQPLALPGRYLDPAPSHGRHPEHLSRDTGSVYSGGTKQASRLNLAGKDDLNQPWDVHAARLVGCVDCHYSPNKPGRQAVPGARRPISSRTRDS